MKKIIALIIYLIPFTGFAQSNFFDSLRNGIKLEKNDSERVRRLIQLGNKIRYTDTMESWRCYRSIDSIATALKNDLFLGQAYFLQATIQMNTQTIPAIDNYEKAIK